MKILAGGKGAIVEFPFGERELRAAVLETVPELGSELDKDDHVYSMISALERAVMHALRSGNESGARAIVLFLDGILARNDVDPEIRNAVGVSFVEPTSLQASPAGRRLWEDMPKRVRDLVGDGS